MSAQLRPQKNRPGPGPSKLRKVTFQSRHPPSKFLSLPAEIREKIYAFVFWRQVDYAHKVPNTRHAKAADYLQDIHTGLLTVNKQVYAESLPITFSCNAFTWPRLTDLFYLTPKPLRAQLTNIREIVVAYEYLDEIVNWQRDQRYPGGFKELMYEYLPLNLERLTVCAWNWGKGELDELDRKPYTIGTRIYSKPIEWVQLLQEVQMFRTVKVTILTEKKVGGRFKFLDGTFPGCVEKV